MTVPATASVLNTLASTRTSRIEAAPRVIGSEEAEDTREQAAISSSVRAYLFFKFRGRSSLLKCSILTPPYLFARFYSVRSVK